MLEYCLICSTPNLIHEPYLHDAWECYVCGTRYWIDDQSRVEFMVYHDVDFQTAEQRLRDGEVQFAPVA